MGKILVDINKLSDKDAYVHLQVILDKLKGEPKDTSKYLLEGLVNLMDDLDEDDFFGTEGWRHRFGFE